MRGLCSLAFVLLCFVCSATIRYKVEPDFAASSIRVSMQIPSGHKDLTVSIPAWCPGFYFLQKYETKLSNIVAVSSAGEKLQTIQSDKRSWRVKNPSGSAVTVSYAVLGDDTGLGFFGVSVKSHTVFINGPAAFLYSNDLLREPCTLKLSGFGDWDVACGLTATNGVLSAKDYDELVDSPIQIGGFTMKSFEKRGLKFEVVWVPPSKKILANVDAQTKVIERIVETTLKMFPRASFNRYVFIVHLSNNGFGGGLEHRASTVLAVGNNPELDLASLASHEFFHTWNVKQVRPHALGPFDYSKENRTKHLWWCEGTTDYFAQLIVYRSGLRSRDWLLNLFSDQIRQLENSRVAKQKTLEEVCWEAWENGGFGVGDLNYYNKGFVVGMLLDFAIRGSNAGKKSLDDAMRDLYSRFLLEKPGFGDNDLRDAITRLSAGSNGDVYDRLTRSTEPPDYKSILSKIGLRLVRPGETVSTIGFVCDGNLVTKIVSTDSQVQIGDRVTKVNGLPFSEFRLPHSADSITVEVLRNGALLEVEQFVARERVTSLRVEDDPFCDQSALERRINYFARE